MDQIRRDFLLGAGGALGGTVLAAPAALSAGRNEVALLSTYIAGTAYYRAHPGDRVRLRREPRNDYDPRDRGSAPGPAPSSTTCPAATTKGSPS